MSASFQLFFDPPETIEEYKRARRSMYLPPSTESELLDYVKRFEEERKTKGTVRGTNGEINSFKKTLILDLLQKALRRSTNDALQMLQNLL